MSAITASVGKGGFNAPTDVLAVETRLAWHRSWLAPMPELSPDSNCTPETIQAIRRFQETACAYHADKVDGVVSPRGFTIKRLALGNIPFPAHQVFLAQCWDRSSGKVTAEDYAAAATKLGCEVEAIQAVTEQETSIRGAWDEVGRPTILFERHKFAKYSAGEWNRTHPDISNPADGGYGRYSAQYPKLYRAATLDQTAALKSASWGSFQIMGDNHKAAGFDTVEAFVDAMLKDQRSHLKAFVDLLTNDGYFRTAKKALQNNDWAKFARIYNGSAYEKNKYDIKIAAIYKALVAKRPPDLRARK